MTRAACIGSLLVLALAAAPGAVFAGGQVRLGTVIISPGYDHYGYRPYAHPYERWHSVRRQAHYAPYYAYRGWSRYYVYYSSPRYYGHHRGFPHRHGRFCGH